MIPATCSQRIGAMSPVHLAKVDALADMFKQAPQERFVTEHLFHAGMYSRTIRLRAGVVLVGALIKIPTVLIVSGMASIFAEDRTVEVNGYGVLPASAGSKRAIVTHSDTVLTMIFPSSATSVDDAEWEFTDDVRELMSHDDENIVVFTGE